RHPLSSTTILSPRGDNVIASGMEPSGTDAAAGSSRTPVGRTVCPSGTPAVPEDGGELAFGERHEARDNASAPTPITVAKRVPLRRPPSLNAMMCFKFSPPFGFNSERLALMHRISSGLPRRATPHQAR